MLCTAPSSRTCPSSIQMHRVHRFSTAAMLCETKSTVRPPLRRSPIALMHFFWKAASPTASTSSTMRISGSKCAATANPSLSLMPLEYRLIGVSMNRSTPAKLTIWSSFERTSLFFIPRIEALR